VSAGQQEPASPPEPDGLAGLLAEFDAALRAGAQASSGGQLPPDAPPSVHGQWQRAQACLRLLEAAWPRRPASPAHVPADQPRTTGSARESLGRFQIRKELGRGGFGVVHLAYDPLLGREVALKVPHAHVLADPELRSRFQREARAAAGLDHPHIVPVYEAGEVNSVAYIALAYCPGITLHDWLRRRIDSIPGPAIAEFLAPLAGAIHHAHEQGVIHRDLKPANVLLGGEFVEESGHLQQPPSLASFAPKITDFGLAKHLDGAASLTHTGTIAGTPCYMAPEQTGRNGNLIGPATDVYSLGAILYELLTGRPPFQGETVLDTLEQVRNQDPIPPRRLRPGLPRDLEIICLKCLDKDPARRYPSAKLLEEDLRRYLSGHSILARPTGPLSQVAKWARRRPAVAALVVVILLAAGVLVASDIYVRQKKRETERALKGEIEARRRLDDSLGRERQALYFHRIRLAQAALLANNVPQAERYLEDCLPPSGQRDLRGWEWHYLKRLCHAELFCFRGHETPVSGLAVSPDGKRMASMSRDGIGKVWEPSTGDVLWEIPPFAGRGPYKPGLAFSPDGQYLAVADTSHSEVTLFQAGDGRKMRSLRGYQPTFSDDGHRLAVVDGAERQAHVYETTSGATLESLAVPKDVRSAIGFRGERLWIAAPGNGQNIHIRQPQSGEEISLSGNVPGTLFSLVFSPNCKHVAMGGSDGVIRLWEASGGEPLFAVKAHTGVVESLTFSPDGRQLASGDTLGSTKIWSLTGQQVRALPGHGRSVYQLAYSGDGRTLASASADQTVKVWDVTRDVGALVYRGHSVAYDLVFSPDSQRVASVGFEQIAKVWDPTSGSTLLETAPGGGFVREVVFSDAGRRIVAVNRDGGAIVWDAASGQPLHQLPGRNPAAVRAVSLSRDGARFATLDHDEQSITIRDVMKGEEKFKCNNGVAVRKMTFSPSGGQLAVASDDLTVKVWDTETGRRLFTLPGHERDIHSVVFSSDGRHIASGGLDTLIRIWDADTGRLRIALENHYGRGYVMAMAFSPDGKRLASAGYDSSVMLWDLATGQEILELPCPQIFVTGVAFSPDGHRLAAIINDGSIMVWDATPQ
jgi:WD40 repeat protein